MAASLPSRKRWARSVSKAKGHSRAHRDLLEYLAYRAGTGQVWGYDLGDLAEGSGVSESQVRRGLTRFVDEGIISIKRLGPRASAYTLHFDNESLTDAAVDTETKSVHHGH